MELADDKVKNQDDVRDFLSTEKTNSPEEKAFYEAMTDFINTRVDDQVDKPENLKEISKAMAQGLSFDDWFDQNGTYVRLYDALVKEMYDKFVGKGVDKELRALKDRLKAVSAIKAKDFQLTDQGLDKVDDYDSDA